jgi:hypothetical protein
MESRDEQRQLLHVTGLTQGETEFMIDLLL